MYRTAAVEGFIEIPDYQLSLIEAACDWAFITDASFTIRYSHKCKRAICDILPSNLVGKSFETFLPIDSRAEIMHLLRSEAAKNENGISTVYTDPLTGLYQIKMIQSCMGDFNIYSITVQRITSEEVECVQRKLYGDYFSSIDKDEDSRLAQQKLITKLSSKIAKNSEDNLDNLFNYILKELGSFMGVDRCSIFRHDLERKTYSVLYEWCAIGISSTKNILQNIPYNDDDEGFIQLTTRPYIAVNDTFQYIGEAYQIQRESGIHAFVDLPILCNGQFWGFLGADYGGGAHNWTESEFNMLQTIGSIMSLLWKKRP